METEGTSSLNFIALVFGAYYITSQCPSSLADILSSLIVFKTTDGKKNDQCQIIIKIKIKINYEKYLNARLPFWRQNVEVVQ